MRRPINKLAFAAHACAMQGIHLQHRSVSRLRTAREMVGDPAALEPVERILVAVVDYYIERGPVTTDVTSLVSQAVKMCARDWAQESEPGTPPAQPDYWYTRGGME